MQPLAVQNKILQEELQLEKEKNRQLAESFSRSYCFPQYLGTATGFEKNDTLFLMPLLSVFNFKPTGEDFVVLGSEIDYVSMKITNPIDTIPYKMGNYFSVPLKKIQNGKVVGLISVTDKINKKTVTVPFGYSLELP